MSTIKGSELLFEKLCDRKGIKWRRIKEDSEYGKKPDYLILIKGQLIVVEIKQFDPSERDKKIWDNFRKGIIEFFAIKTKYEIADKIRSGKKQLKPFSVRPTLLILMDNTGGISSLEGSHLYEAMHGFNGILSSNRTTYLSAIGRLKFLLLEEKGELDIFYNSNTTNSLDPSILKSLARKQYKVDENTPDNFTARWLEIEV